MGYDNIKKHVFFGMNLRLMEDSDWEIHSVHEGAC